ncbi:YsnF/AvaK domain-containing protein [Leptolyngbya sp. 15MV]|nr:YsnF/AvaK domain-containing protein [Leptolyngbya sp. 15MV]
MDPAHADGAEEAALPLLEESVSIGRRAVHTGRVRIAVSTEAEERFLRETLRGERAEIEHVPLGRELAQGEAAPAMRREPDGTLVIPVVEEVLVVERRLVLREEIRLRIVATEEVQELHVPVRRQVATIERLPADARTMPCTAALNRLRSAWTRGPQTALPFDRLSIR